MQPFIDHLGGHKWLVQKHAESAHALYRPEDVIMLSPDASEPLLDVNDDKIYIIGGIVDRSVQKFVTLEYAERHGISNVRRLPIQVCCCDVGVTSEVQKDCEEFNSNACLTLAIQSALADSVAKNVMHRARLA